jgi:hypothetical protein
VDYQLALAERDRLGLPDAWPIYARLRDEAGAERRREAPRRQPVLESDSDRRHQSGHVDSAPAYIEDQPPSPKRRGGMPKGARRRPRSASALESQPPPRTFLLDQFVDGPKQGAEIEAEALGVRCRRGQWWLPG